MTYFVFIESAILSVPHMEPMDALTQEDAMAEARDLMGLHSSAVAAHVFLDDKKVGTITRDEFNASFWRKHPGDRRIAGEQSE